MNDNGKLPLVIDFQKAGYFNVTPKSVTLPPSQTQNFVAQFAPLSLGAHQASVELHLFKQYKLLMRCSGFSDKQQRKVSLKRGLECNTQDFDSEQRFFDQSSVVDKTQCHSSRSSVLIAGLQSVSVSRNLMKIFNTENSQNFDVFMQQMQHKHKYNDYLKQEIQQKRLKT